MLAVMPNVLPGLHDVEVMLARCQRAEHLIEHLAVLGRDAHHGLNRWCCRLKTDDHGGHLDGLGAGAEDE